MKFAQRENVTAAPTKIRLATEAGRKERREELLALAQFYEAQSQYEEAQTYRSQADQLAEPQS